MSESESSTKLLMRREYDIEKANRNQKATIIEVIIAVYEAKNATGFLKELQDKLKKELDFIVEERIPIPETLNGNR